jgi:curved DNA-binding protein CbpA
MINIKDARAMLGVSRDFSLEELNKRFRILALRLHPDKNGNTPEATAAFQELNAAYRLLLPGVNDRTNKYSGAGAGADANADIETYSNIFMNFMKSLFRSERNPQQDDADGVNPILLDLLHRIVHDYASGSVNAALDSLDPSVLFQLYDTLEQYNAAVSMDARVFEEITQTLREKMQKNNIIVLRPSLKDVLQNNISVLQYEGQTFYVPLWHSELHYRVEGSDKQLIVKCVPVLPDHMSIDANNELRIDVRADIRELLNRSGGVLRIPLYDDECVELKVGDLHIKSGQIIVLQNNKFGISLICSNDIYEVNNKAPIRVCVQLT